MEQRPIIHGARDLRVDLTGQGVAGQHGGETGRGESTRALTPTEARGMTGVWARSPPSRERRKDSEHTRLCPGAERLECVRVGCGACWGEAWLVVILLRNDILVNDQREIP